MKHSIFKVAFILVIGLVITFSSCNKDGDETISLQMTDNGGNNSGGGGNNGGGGSTGTADEYDNYFTVDGATYETGDMPGDDSYKALNTSGNEISYNSKVLAGGMNYITIRTSFEFTYFYIGIKGFRGYWRWSGHYSYQEGGYFYYIILLRFSLDFDRSFTIYFGGLDGYREYYKPIPLPIVYEPTKKGDLNINLTFSNAKDIDLHLYTPSNLHIWWNQPQYSYNGTTFGLDHDSNRGCRIDNLNNENIWVPSSCIENGTYRVVVDMYKNCTPSVSTSWMVVARYRGQVLKTASGVYSAGAGNGDMTEVMTFAITSANQVIHRPQLTLLPLSEEAQQKWFDFIEGCE